MSRIVLFSTVLILLTALLGALIPSPDVCICACIDGECRRFDLFRPYQFAMFGGLGLAYAMFINRGRVAVMRKSRELATVSYLFAPVLAFLIQLAIALHILFRLGDDWANLAIYGLTLALIMSVGNSVATTRRDSFGGLRNRWSVSSRTVWFRTQRLHGRTLVFGGLASLALIPLASFGIALLALLVTYIASIIAATAYSAYLANTLEPAL